MPVLNPESLIQNRAEAIRAFHDQVGQARAEIDVSGGVDSAVMLALLSEALGPRQVTAAFLGINSSARARERAVAAAEACGISLIVDDLSAEFDQRIAAMIDRLTDAGYDRNDIERRIARDPTVLGSIRSCLRAPLGRGYNRLTGGGIRHGTGNECEDRFLRFYQKGGDGEVDTNPIAMLSKGEVYQLGRALGVPAAVLVAKPSPDLWGASSDHSDEAELHSWSGVAWTYSRVDPDTGAYLTTGSIERLSRYLDLVEDALFDANRPLDDFLHGRGVPAAIGHPIFTGIGPDELEGFFVSARRLEAATRHKANPNIPTLGARIELTAAEILTDDLPS